MESLAYYRHSVYYARGYISSLNPAALQCRLASQQ